jgi:hypothetical protein
VGDVTEGVLRSPEGGTPRVYVRWNGRLQPLMTRGTVKLGDGSVGGRGTAYATWLARGRLYTRVTTSRPDRYRIYLWQPVGGSAYTPPILRAISLGTLCLDETPRTYDTCPTRR